MPKPAHGAKPPVRPLGGAARSNFGVSVKKVIVAHCRQELAQLVVADQALPVLDVRKARFGVPARHLDLQQDLGALERAVECLPPQLQQGHPEKPNHFLDAFPIFPERHAQVHREQDEVDEHRRLGVDRIEVEDVLRVKVDDVDAVAALLKQHILRFQVQVEDALV